MLAVETAGVGSRRRGAFGSVPAQEEGLTDSS